MTKQNLQTVLPAKAIAQLSSMSIMLLADLDASFHLATFSAKLLITVPIIALFRVLLCSLSVINRFKLLRVNVKEATDWRSG